MQRILVDACVLIALCNVKDEHHKKALKFFEEMTTSNKGGDTINVVLPAHALVEVNVSIQRLKKQNELKAYPSFTATGGPEIYDIDRKFINKIQSQNLYKRFSVLKSSDSIYGMIAHLENIPLYTLDRGFDRVKDIVEVHLL